MNVCEAVKYLYVVNKRAKQYRNQATERYQNGKKAAAKKNSERKNALYELKSRVLQKLSSHADTVELHYIPKSNTTASNWVNSTYSAFYCYYFTVTIDGEDITFSFHQPITKTISDTISISKLHIFTEFDSDVSQDLVSSSLKEALIFFNENGFTINEYFDTPYVQYGTQSYFVGWSYLSDTTSRESNSTINTEQTTLSSLQE